MPELLPCAPGSPEWLAARRAGVTATDIVTILGLSSWSSAYSLFWQKMGQVPETPDNDRFRLGRELEPYVIARWREACLPADGLAPLAKHRLYRSADRPWQMATIDQAVWTHPESLSDPADSLLEVKTWADADRPAWQDGPPPAVRAQVLWQMDVMGVAAGHVGVVFLPSGEFRSYTIRHDPDTGAMGHPKAFCSVCADLEVMRAAGEEFMARLRLELPAPDPDASAATLAAVKARFAKVPDKQAEVDGALFREWDEDKIISDYYADEASYLETLMREQAGEASVLTVDGQPVARRIVGEAQVKAHTRRSDYLKRISTGQETSTESQEPSSKPGRLPASEYKGTSYTSDPVSDLLGALGADGDE